VNEPINSKTKHADTQASLLEESLESRLIARLPPNAKLAEGMPLEHDLDVEGLTEVEVEALIQYMRTRNTASRQ
jgi:hypothetical protein